MKMENAGSMNIKARGESHLDLLRARSLERHRDRSADKMAKVFCITRHRRNFSRCSNVGNRCVHCVRRRQNPASRISHRTSAAEEIGTPGLDRECKAPNAKVIPSEVEESRGIIEWSPSRDPSTPRRSAQDDSKNNASILQCLSD